MSCSADVFTLHIDDAQLRLLWAGAKHYRNVYADLRDGRHSNNGRLQTAIDCMGQLEAEARRRKIDLTGRKG